MITSKTLGSRISGGYMGACNCNGTHLFAAAAEYGSYIV